MAKYLAKSAIARVRASQGYGQQIADPITPYGIDGRKEDVVITTPDTPTQKRAEEETNESHPNRVAYGGNQ